MPDTKKKFISEGDTFTQPICNRCKHDNGDGTCKAFPDEIPGEILNGESNHEKPFYGQKNNITFTEKESE